MSDPSTPRRLVTSPAFSSVRRVHTLPSKFIDPTQTPPQIPHSDDAIETLISLDFARVVSFEDPNARPGSSRSERSFNVHDHSHASVPWTTPTERTLAAGPFRIYRVPNTGISFLNSGAFLKAILQRTQSWCVDDGTKFIFKSQNYYRIELPSATEHERSQIEELKQALDKLCRYEKTSCPFRDGYHQEQEQPPTPLRRQSSTTERAKKWRLNGVWEPEDEERRARFVQKNQELRHQLQHQRSFSLKAKNVKNEENLNLDPFFRSQQPTPRASSYGGTQPPRISLKPAPSPEKVKANRFSGHRIERFEQASRGCIAQPQRVIEEDKNEDLALCASSASNTMETSNEPVIHLSQLTGAKTGDGENKITTPIVPDIQATQYVLSNSTNSPQIIVDTNDEVTDRTLRLIHESETLSIHSSRDSFYSADDDVSLYHEPRLSPGADSLHSRSSSPGTAVPPTPRYHQEAPWPPLMDDSKASPYPEDIISNDHPDDTIKVTSIAQALRRRRAFPILENEDSENDVLQSPAELPIPLSSTFHPRGIGGAVIRKTYNILLGPSCSLITLMIRIAQQILRRSGPKHRRNRSIPGAWDSESESTTDEDETEWEDAIELDDYGYPVSGRSTSSVVSKLNREESVALNHAVDDIGRVNRDAWEVD